MNRLIILLILSIVFILACISVGVYFLVFHKKDNTKYSWEVKEQPDASCSKPCGGGVRYRTILCETQDNKVVDPKYCDKSKKPPEVEPCNTQKCEEWVSAPDGNIPMYLIEDDHYNDYMIRYTPKIGEEECEKRCKEGDNECNAYDTNKGGDCRLWFIQDDESKTQICKDIENKNMQYHGDGYTYNIKC